MRFMVTATWDTESGNRAIKSGKMVPLIEKILGDIKPEAVYLTAHRGKRTMISIVNVPEASRMVAIAEPFFLAFDATVEFEPVMTPEDLAKAGPDMEKAVKNYA